MSDTFTDDFEIEFERYELFEAPWHEFEFDRREFLKVLGGGILIGLLVPSEVPAQPRRGRRGGNAAPQALGAWLHIDEAGKVAVFCGKAEVGQNVRTMAAQMIAEELRLKPAEIETVLADTDRVPYDAGTFGSRSSPVMSPQLRRAGAAARQLLLQLAAESSKLDVAELELADGKVTHAPSKKSWMFGELTKGQKLTEMISGEVATTPVDEWKVAGTSVPKVNARAIVTGAHQYASDIRRPGMLHGKVLRPPTLKSTLKSADVKAAESVDSTVVVRDGSFIGVAAPSQHQAESALGAIQAEWDSPQQPSDKTLFEDLKKESRGGGRGFGGGNRDVGSVEKGLEQADHKLQATYTIAYIAHAPLEPRAAVAEWENGKLTVWTGTQRPFGVRSELARAFAIPETQVRVIVPDTGSGYGGKHNGEAAIEAARLAKAAGKPVKLVWTREEEFTWAYFRPAGVIEVNAGVTRDGRIVAWEFHNWNSGGSAIAPLYDIPNQRNQFHSSDAPLRQGSYRALAATANHFARESHIDDLAELVKLDPLEFRLKNLKDDRLRAVLEAVAKAFGWKDQKPQAGRGVGIAGGSEKGSYVATCAEVEIGDGGQVSVRRLVTAFECGAVLNPDHLKNQIEGAMVQGLGGALFEAVRFENGQIVNAGFTNYRVPRFGDLPKLEVVLVNRPDLPSEGAGETPIVAVAPAIGNAIRQATGKRLRSMPMAPDGVKG